MPPPQPARYAYQQASLWSTGPTGLLGDRRARSLGDILTVTIEIDDKAEMKNATDRATARAARAPRSAAFFGVRNMLPPGMMKLNPNVEIGSQSEYQRRRLGQAQREAEAPRSRRRWCRCCRTAIW